MFVKPSQPNIIGSVDELVRQDKIQWFFPNKGSFELRGKNAEEGSTLKWTFGMTYLAGKLEDENFLSTDLFSKEEFLSEEVVRGLLIRGAIQ